MDLTNYVTLEFFDEKLAAKQDNLTAGSNISITNVDGEFIISAVDTTYSNASQQTSGLMSPADKTKIDGITAEKIQAWDAAEQNIQSDWLQNDETADDYIKNKPNFALAADVNNALSDKANALHTHEQSEVMGLETALLGKADASHTHTKSQITDLTSATTSTPGLMSAADKAKLDGISATAEVNVQANWSQTNSEADDYIQNKPDLSIYAESEAVTTALSGKVDKETGKSLMSTDEHTKLFGIETGAQVNTVTGVKGSNEAEYRTGNISITKGNVGLGNVDNTADADKPISTAAQTALDGKVDKITGKGLSEANFTDAEKTKLAGIAAGAEVNVQSDWNQGNDAADDYIKNKPSNLVQDASYVHTDNNFTNAEKAKADGAIQSTEKGTANGVAELDANGKVPTSQLPAYVDDVLSYSSLSDFPATGEDGKIYIAKDTNLSYRWGSSEYVVISPSLALGSTSSTAYRGDWGAEDRAAIGTLSTLNTTEKSNLVGAINELKTDSDAKQGTLDFDSAPTSGSTNPVTSGGVYAALAGKQDTLDFDSAPTENSDNLVKSGVIYTALVGKADATAVQTALNSKADATATQTALAGKQNALTAGANITIETVNDALTISATDTTYSDATQQTHGLMSTADKTKLDGVQTGATTVSVTQTLASGTKIGTVTVNGTGTDLYCETNTDTTYSAGTGLSLSGTTFSNSAPNVKSDWNAAAGTDAEILNKPTIPNYSNATTSAAGLMSATDKSTLNAINAGTQVSLMSSSGTDLVSASNNRLILSSSVSNFRAIEIRYAMYTGASTYTSIVRAVNKDGQGDYGNIAALVVRADTAGSLSLYMCNLQLSGSNLTLSAVNNIPSFYVYNVWGYK